MLLNILHRVRRVIAENSRRSRAALRLATIACVPLFAVTLASTAWGATFGKVVPIGGHASDIVLDEPRGVLYAANYTANRIDVISLSDYVVHRSINVAPQPGSLALSPDGRFLVIAHFGPFEPPNTPANALTVINLGDNTRRTFGFGQPPLGVAFGIDGLALIVTTTDFILFDPVSGSTQVIGSVFFDIVAKALPSDAATMPPNIIQASVTASRDGRRIYGLIDTFQSSEAQTTAVRFSYNVAHRRLLSHGLTATPALGPRVVSVSGDGSYYMAGWGLFGCDFRNHLDCDVDGPLVAQMPNASGLLSVGSHVIDSARNTIYAQVPEGDSSGAKPPVPVCVPLPNEGGEFCFYKKPDAASSNSKPQTPPELRVLDADNLATRERLRLAENLAGRSVLDSAGEMMYAISDSGVTVLPVGLLDRSPRVAASQEDVVFRGGFCDQRVMTQEIAITSAGNMRVPFSLVASSPGIEITPSSGVTPANVAIRVDPSAFQNQKGTVAVNVELISSAAVNIPAPIRVLINTKEPDQRGTMVNVPGKLVDLLADPVRNRFYILRQDKNQVLVFDGASYSQIAVLRTSMTPTSMAFTFDRKYLMVGHNDSHMAYVYDLDELQPVAPIIFPIGHYPRSLAAAGKTILAATRVAGPVHKIDRVDFAARTATELPSLGIYKNDIHAETVLEATPNGAAILVAQPNGNLMLYDANANTFAVSRKDFESLSGAYAASSYGYYIVDNNLLNSSLVVVGKMETASGTSSGFAFVDQYGFRTTAGSAGNGMIQRVNLARGEGILPTRTVEAPLTTAAGPFTRALGVLADRSAMVALSISGFTVLPWDYDAATVPPRLDRVVNAADFTRPVAPGGLISVFGSDLSPVNMASREVPLPTALGESCLTVNGVPVPMIFASSRQINAQLPFNVDGNAMMVLRTPGGVSDTLNFTILPSAPGVFRSGTAGPETGIPTVVRMKNNDLVTPSNPIHPGDHIVIYLTGLGKTSPQVEAGMPAPMEPLASALVQPDVTINGVPLQVLYAGLAPGQVGIYQINAIVPSRGVPTGFNQPLEIMQGGQSTTLMVRVVD